MDLRFPALIATSFVGFVLTGATLFVTVFGKVSQLGHRNSLLSCVSFLLWSNLFWSLWVFLISIENLYAPRLQNGASGLTFCHISAGIINGFIPWLWGGNLLLAIQRYYTNKYDKELPPRVFWGVFCGVITASGIALGINLADDVPLGDGTPLSQGCLVPQNQHVKTVYLTLGISFMIFMSLATTVFYFLASRNLVPPLANPMRATLKALQERAERYRVQRQLLTRSVVLSVSLLFALLAPVTIFALETLNDKFNQEPDWFWVFTNLWPSLSFVATPYLILHLTN